MRLRILFLLGLLTLPLAAADTERVLIPVFYQGPGAFGTFWVTIVVINNHSSQPVRAPGVTFGILCPIPEGCMSSDVPPFSFGALAKPESASGLIVYIPAGEADRVIFSAQLSARPRVLLYNGTQLPIARERDFRTDAVHLPYVPLRGRPVRTSLRIYGPDAQEGIQVRVDLRCWCAIAGEPDESRVFALTTQPSPDPANPIYPAYIELNVQKEFARASERGTFDNIEITPLPLPSGAVPRIWAFVTVTDNVTNEVLVISPQ